MSNIAQGQNNNQVGKLSRDLPIFTLLTNYRQPIKFYQQSASVYDDDEEKDINIDFNHCIVSFDIENRIARGRKYFIKTMEIHYYIDKNKFSVYTKFYEIDFDYSRHKTDYRW